ncbi:MAG: ribbon-helix-helix domain-containing protein [Planctomycetota bacterium]
MTKEIHIPDETYRGLKALLSSRGKDIDVDEFVNRTLNRAIFFETVRGVRAKTKSADPDELDQLIDEAVETAREGNNQINPDAGRS